MKSDRCVALFVDRRGPYFDMVADCWDADRDATTYDGDLPAVMHPPCARWSRLAHLAEMKYGIPKRRDGGLFRWALDTLERVGGILEHPANSMAWDEYGLPKPEARGWWTVDAFSPFASARVDQGVYGNPYRKPTWLLMRVTDPLPELSRDPGRGLRITRKGEDKSGGGSFKRSETPLPFARLLISAAEGCHADG